MSGFTPWSALAGGALIGLSASILLVFTGRIAGIAGIVGGLVRPRRGDWTWRAWFVAGLLVGAAALSLAAPRPFVPAPRSLATLAVAGLLVGIGTRLGNGCTSGHAVCGVARLNERSFVATFVFVGTAVVTVTALRVFGVAL